MIRKDAILVPTFSISHQIINHVEKYGVVPWAIDKGRESRRESLGNYRKAYYAGVKIAMGTDFSTAPLLKNWEQCYGAEANGGEPWYDSDGCITGRYPNGG